MDIKRIAILGCGYVGTAVALACLKRGISVSASTTTPGRVDILRAHGFDPMLWTADDAATLSRIIRNQDAILLCLAPSDRTLPYREVYLRAAESLVCALPGTSVRRVLYTSSTRVYAQDDGCWVDESSPTEPRDENGRALVEAEKRLLSGVTNLAKAEGRTLSATVLRLGGIYGPQRDPAQRIATLAGQSRDDGDEWVNLIHLDDIVQAIAILLNVPHHGTLNVTDDQPMTRRDYYDALLAARGLEPIRWAASGPKRGKRVCNRAIKALLGQEFRQRIIREPAQ